jgi:hypothetical protein
VIGWSQMPLPTQTHNKLKRRKSMPSAGFEPTIQAFQRHQTYGLDDKATGFGNLEK